MPPNHPLPFRRACAAAAATLAALLLLDFAWLGHLATPIYRAAIGHLLATPPRLDAAAAFYLVYAAGLWVFALRPHAANPAWRPSLQAAGLFGLFAYATYDLTNLATLAGWPLWLSLMDIAWGVLASVVAVAAGKGVLRRGQAGG